MDSILHSPEQTPLSQHPGRWNVLPHPLSLGSAWSWVVSSLDRSKGLRTCCVLDLRSCSLSGEELTLLARGGSDTHGADRDQPAAWSWAQKSPAWTSEIPVTHRHLSRGGLLLYTTKILQWLCADVENISDWDDHQLISWQLDLEFKRHSSVPSSFSAEGAGQGPKRRLLGWYPHMEEMFTEDSSCEQNPDFPQTCLKKHGGHDKREKNGMLYAG